MNTRTFRMLAEASSQAYKKPLSFADWFGKFGLGSVDFIEKGGTNSYCFETEQERVLVFRGSVPHRLKDWQRDANLNKMALAEGGYVHEGFCEALDRIWPPVKKWLTTAGSKKLWLTGHSLGGALALLASMRLERVECNVCTFGQPRVGDSTFAEDGERKLGRRYFRFVHHRDIVVRVPFYTLGYRHFGREFRIEKGRITEVKFGKETVEDAMRLIVGSEVEIPGTLKAMLESMLKFSEVVSRPEAIGPAIAVIRAMQAPLAMIGGATLEVFFEAFVKQILIQKQSLVVVGPVHDHDPEYYINAFRPLVLQP